MLKWLMMIMSMGLILSCLSGGRRLLEKNPLSHHDHDHGDDRHANDKRLGIRLDPDKATECKVALCAFMALYLQVCGLLHQYHNMPA